MYDPTKSGMIAAGGDAASTIISGLFGQHSAKQAMKYQTHMSNTAYQRASVDLEKAGLNRILAVGSPAASPPGQTSTMPDAKLGSSFQAGSSAKAQRNVQAATERLLGEQAFKTHNEGVAAAEQAENIRADTALKRSSALLNQSSISEITARIPTYAQQMGLNAQQQKNLEQQLKLYVEQTKLAGNEVARSEVTTAAYKAVLPFLEWLTKFIPKPPGANPRPPIKNPPKGPGMDSPYGGAWENLWR